VGDKSNRRGLDSQQKGWGEGQGDEHASSRPADLQSILKVNKQKLAFGGVDVLLKFFMGIQCGSVTELKSSGRIQ